MQCDWRDASVQLASLIRAHKGSIVVYTGAGISTATSIPDYRGTNGLWMYQKRARASGRSRSRPSGNKLRNSNVLPKPESTRKLDPTRRVEVHTKLRLPEATTARPTFTHMAIKVLVEQGYVRHVVSQNVDGLHMRSGLPREKLSELHGNLFLEQCIACDHITMRNFDVAETTGRGQHLTGRVCPICRVLRPADYSRALDTLSASVESRLRLKKSRFLSPEFLVLAQKSAATQLSRATSANAPGQPLPLLRDVVVHFYERQPPAGLQDIYRVASAIEAVHGRVSLRASVLSAVSACTNVVDGETTTSSSPPTLRNAPWFQRMLPAFKQSPLSSFDDHTADSVPSGYDSPATLILVLGSSLRVLRNYGFLWPHGLRRCLGERASPALAKSPPSSPLNSTRCHLAIVNLQPTCKDGLADLVIHASCDQVLEFVLHQCLGVQVPAYSVENDDPLFRESVPLEADEEHTRTRPSIPFHLYTKAILQKDDVLDA